jgi:hypothetical protein
MKTFFTLAGLISAAISQAFGFAEITNWAGSGPNQTALVIDWNDGVEPSSLVWGYRWSGTATGTQMLSSIMTADPRLSRVMGGGGPQSIFGLGYDTDGDGLPLLGSGEWATPADPGDHYRAGWFESGFWGYFVSSNTTEFPTDWAWGGGDLFDGPLANNDWRGFSFAPGFDGGAPSVPSNPAPEPASFLAVGAGVLVLARRRR